MKTPNPLPDSYFEKYPLTPVEIKPYLPQQKQIGERYIAQLKTILKEFDPEMEIGGSTALEIEGKGDIEINIYCTPQNWKGVNEELLSLYEYEGNRMTDYVRYNDFFEKREIEVIVTKGETASIQRQVLNYIKTHPEVHEAYRQLKKKYKSVEREYCRQKNLFFEKIVSQLT